MRWDTVHEMIMKGVTRLFLIIWAFLIIAPLVCYVLPCIHVSALDSLIFLLVWLFFSPIAYRIRMHRLNIHPRPRNTRGAERTPLLPRFMEGQE